MSFHNHYDQWQAMTEKSNCPICQQQPMLEGMVDIVDLPNSWLDAEPVDCLKGACTLLAKRHVIELYDFEDNELLLFMKEVQLCAKALKTVTGAVKINYEIHGNSVPHLHVHLYPRYQDDPFPDQAIDYRQKKRWYSEEEFAIFCDNMRSFIKDIGH